MKFEGIMPALITPLNEDNKTVNEKGQAVTVLNHYFVKGTFIT